MKRIFIIGLLFLYAFTLYSQSNIRYYFKTLDIQDGLSQNTVNAILQDKQGFMWFGTKDGLNRFDGLSFRIFKKENSALGNNFITALHEDKEGNIWVGTDAGVYVYNPLLEDFTVFDRVSDTGDMISRAVTRIESDEDSDIWISVDYQGLFHFDRVQDRLINCLHRDKRKNQLANVTRFWFEEKLCWVSLYDDNLYYTKDNFKTLFPFQDSEGKEPFKDDIINTWIMGPHNCWYIGSSNGLTEINLTTGRVRRLLNYYVRDLGFKSDKELWVGTESGLYIYDLEKGEIAHLTVSNGNDSYALADNAIYSICRDNEGGMCGSDLILAGSITIRVNGLILKNSTLVMILKILGVGYVSSVKVMMVLFGLVLKIRDYFIFIRKVERLKNSHILLFIKMFMVYVWTVMICG